MTPATPPNGVATGQEEETKKPGRASLARVKDAIWGRLGSDGVKLYLKKNLPEQLPAAGMVRGTLSGPNGAQERPARDAVSQSSANRAQVAGKGGLW